MKIDYNKKANEAWEKMFKAKTVEEREWFFRQYKYFVEKM